MGWRKGSVEKNTHTHTSAAPSKQTPQLTTSTAAISSIFPHCHSITLTPFKNSFKKSSQVNSKTSQLSQKITFWHYHQLDVGNHEQNGLFHHINSIHLDQRHHDGHHARSAHVALKPIKRREEKTREEMR